MGIFCKLFERDGDQILVRKGVDDDGSYGLLVTVMQGLAGYIG